MTEKTNVDKKKFLVSLTLREIEALKEITVLEEQKKLPVEHKSELFRRGLHSAIQLIKVNEKPLLRLLVKKLDDTTKDLSTENIESVKSLSLVVYSTLIAKQGKLGADSFQSIPLTCQYLDLIEDEKVNKKRLIEIIHDLATSIRTIFLQEESDTYQNILKSTAYSQDKNIKLEDTKELEESFEDELVKDIEKNMSSLVDDNLNNISNLSRKRSTKDERVQASY